MGERGVPDIVEERSASDLHRLVIVEPERVAHPAGDMKCPEGVLEPCLMSSREYQVCEGELFDVMQPLEFRRLDQVEEDPVDGDAPMDRIVDDFSLFHIQVNYFTYTILCRCK
jgi:hypothetical protein